MTTNSLIRAETTPETSCISTTSQTVDNAHHNISNYSDAVNIPVSIAEILHRPTVQKLPSPVKPTNFSSRPPDAFVMQTLENRL
jgi:hypothetical protein